jgi:hypothetical protein
MHVETMSNAYLRCHRWQIYPGLQAITRMAKVDGLKEFLIILEPKSLVRDSLSSHCLAVEKSDHAPLKKRVKDA